MPTRLGQLRVLAAALVAGLSVGGAQPQADPAGQFSATELLPDRSSVAGEAAATAARSDQRGRRQSRRDGARRHALLRHAHVEERRGGLLDLPPDRPAVPGRPSARQRHCHVNRRTQPLAGVAWQRWFFWDGRKDSLWSQALAPLEKPQEHGLNRTWYAHFMAENFRERYGRIFGPMPDLASVPRDAGPFNSEEARAGWASNERTKTAMRSIASSSISARRSRPSKRRSTFRKRASTVLPRRWPTVGSRKAMPHSRTRRLRA